MSAPVAQFLADVVRCTLLTAPEIRSILSAHGLREENLDSQSLSNVLVSAGKLTAFQAQALAAGKLDRLVLGKYVILDKIGAGGMGEVFQAIHRQMERIVAIKVISAKGADSPDAVERFRREVKIASRLSHRNIVTAYDADEHEGSQYLVMEFVDGKSLGALIRARGPFPVENALDVAIQTAEGLTHAHGEGLIHRDIKPGNLLLDRRGTVKILDLGLARAVSELEVGAAQDPNDLTRSGQVLGTCHYMAPEQALSARLADERSDIYSLGCTLYCLLTARTPYGGESLVETLLAHRESPIPWLAESRSDIPPRLEATFRKMLAKAPADRQQTMAEVLHELKMCRGPTAATPAPVGQLLAAAEEIVVPPEESDHSTTRNIPQAKDTMNGVVLELSEPSGPAERFSWLPLASSVLVGAGLVSLLLMAFLAWKSPRGVTPIVPEPGPDPAVAGPNPSGEPAADSAWRELLAMVTPRIDTVAGDWRFEGEQLVASGGAGSRIEVPFVPIAGYELRVEFMRAGNGELSVMFPVERYPARIFLRGPGENLVGGLDADPAAAGSASEAPRPIPLPPLETSKSPGGASLGANPDGEPRLPSTTRGVTHTLAITVLLKSRGASITANLDGRQFVNWRGEAADLTLSPDWKLEETTRFGLGSVSPAEFHSVRVRQIESAPRPVVVLSDHTDVVTSVAFSRDGNSLASGGYDKQIHVWSVTRETLLHALAGHEGRVTTIAFDASGETLASGSSDGTVRLWDVAKGVEKTTLGKHDRPVMSVAWHPSGTMLLSGGADNSVKAWQASGGEPTNFAEHGGWVPSLAFSPAGDRIATACWDGSIRLWEVPTRPQSVLTREGSKFEAVAFAPSLSVLAAGNQAGQVLLWDLPADGPGRLIGHSSAGGVTCLAWTPSGEHLAVGLADGSVQWWDVKRNDWLPQLDAHRSAVYGIAFAPDGYLATCGEDKVVRLWHAPSVISAATAAAATSPGTTP
ncbi:MAG: serine/threonine-protein kinase [Pirellulaceae bacterium]|nr:serine/threonine-protein kinase [Pirellulaceae bacterium]